MRLAQYAGYVGARELLGGADGDLQVLRLVRSDGHLVGIEGENVGGHQDRMAVEVHQATSIRPESPSRCLERRLGA